MASRSLFVTSQDFHELNSDGTNWNPMGLLIFTKYITEKCGCCIRERNVREIRYHYGTSSICTFVCIPPYKHQFINWIDSASRKVVGRSILALLGNNPRPYLDNEITLMWCRRALSDHWFALQQGTAYMDGRILFRITLFDTELTSSGRHISRDPSLPSWGREGRYHGVIVNLF